MGLLKLRHFTVPLRPPKSATNVPAPAVPESATRPLKALLSTSVFCPSTYNYGTGNLLDAVGLSYIVYRIPRLY